MISGARGLKPPPPPTHPTHTSPPVLDPSPVDIIKKFGDATGLIINLHKNSVAVIHCEDLNLGITITYLDIPIALGRLRLVHLQGVA
jgi:hypothetical protein